MYKPTNKELLAIIAIAAMTAVILVSAGFGAVGSVLVATFSLAAEYWRIARRSAQTSTRAGS
jgi:hypothetical protein